MVSYAVINLALAVTITSLDQPETTEYNILAGI